MRFLLVIRHGLYLRNYESVVRQLARCGHDVQIAVSDPKPVDDTLLRALPAEHPQVSVCMMPERTGWWWAANDPLRAIRDYFRYFEPAYADARLLVERGSRRIPANVRFIFERIGLGRLPPLRRAIDRILALVERSTPPDSALRAWIAAQRPDAVLITPLVEFQYVQLDVLKAARALGLPTALLVASWDNLTNKGLIQIEPDLVMVWNETQRREAATMHRVDPGKVVVTGAQLYDHWFEMKPAFTREAFCARVGSLDPARPIILYLCSSTFICPYEVGAVRQWLRAVRQSRDPLLSSANVVIRPHPIHGKQWSEVDLAEFGNAAVWPARGAAPLDQERKQDYFDNLHHAAAVVGINTSGFLEASIVGRPSLALRTDEFSQAQEGTLHFRYLLAGGIVRTAETLDAHLAELGRLLRSGADAERQVQAFVGEFLRPGGLDRPCTPILADALQRLAATAAPAPARAPHLAPLVRAAAALPAVFLRRAYLARLASRPLRARIAEANATARAAAAGGEQQARRGASTRAA